MKAKFAAALLAGAAVTMAPALTTPALAHHSYAMFDKAKEVELKGAVVKDWQWTSPHTWLYVVVPTGHGEPTKYSIEGGNPGLMRRLGFSKGSMSPGDKVTIYIAPLRSGENGGSLNAVVLTNGKLMGERMKKEG